MKYFQLTAVGMETQPVMGNLFLLLQRVPEFLIKFRVHGGNQLQGQGGPASCLSVSQSIWVSFAVKCDSEIGFILSPHPN